MRPRPRRGAGVDVAGPSPPKRRSRSREISRSTSGSRSTRARVRGRSASRGVVGVVDRAEHDLDRAARAQRVRPLDAEIARRPSRRCRGGGAAGARCSRTRATAPDPHDEHGHVRVRDHVARPSSRAGAVAVARARRDRRSGRAPSVSANETQRLVRACRRRARCGSPDRAAGRRARALRRRAACARASASSSSLDDVNEDDFAVTAQGGERASDVERAALPARDRYRR